MTIFPNPVSDMVNISFSNSISSTLSMSIIDLTGRILRDMMMAVQDGEVSLQLNIDDLPGGVYILTLRDEFSIVAAEKFIKQ